MTKETIQNIMYERYKMRWMSEHNITVSDLVNEAMSYAEDILSDPVNPVGDTLRISQVLKGLRDGTISFIKNPNDGALSCQIGDNWFYFTTEYEDMDPKAFVTEVKPEKIARMIIDATEELDDTERTYYISVLYTPLTTKDIVYEAFRGWEESGNGFNGMLWAGKSEFLETEYKNMTYASTMLTTTDEFAAWYSDISGGQTEIEKEASIIKTDIKPQKTDLKPITGDIANVPYKVRREDGPGYDERGGFITRKDTSEILYIGLNKDGYWGWAFYAPEIFQKEQTKEELENALAKVFNGDYETKGFSTGHYESIKELTDNLGIWLDRDQMKHLENSLEPFHIELALEKMGIETNEYWQLVGGCQTHHDIGLIEDIITVSRIDVRSFNSMMQSLAYISREIYRGEISGDKDMWPDADSIINEVRQMHQERDEVPKEAVTNEELITAGELPAFRQIPTKDNTKNASR